MADTPGHDAITPHLTLDNADYGSGYWYGTTYAWRIERLGPTYSLNADVTVGYINDIADVDVYSVDLIEGSPAVVTDDRYIYLAYEGLVGIYTNPSDVGIDHIYYSGEVAQGYWDNDPYYDFVTTYDGPYELHAHYLTTENDFAVLRGFEGAGYKYAIGSTPQLALAALDGIGETKESWGSDGPDILVLGPENDVAYGLGGDDILDGGDGNDALYGGAGFDTLFGGAGNDILDGGTNPDNQGDIMLGGAGDDTYYVDSTLDLVDEGFVFPDAGWGGTDTIISTANWYWDSQSVGEIVRIAENASDPTGAGVTFVGGIFDNVLYGHSGTDILFGRGGNDIYRAGDGVDWISLSTLGLTDENAYAGVDGHNTVIVDPRSTGKFSYDIIFEFDPLKDKVDVSAYGDKYASGADVLSHAVDDGAGSSYIALGDGLDYLYFVGLSKADLLASDFIV